MAQKIALVHDFLLDLRGAERVFSAICDTWPEADVFTAVYDPKGTEGRFEARRGRLATACRARLANAAVRAFDKSTRAWQARDWNGVRATYHPAHRMDDRRRLMRVEVAGDAFFANERLLFDDTASDWRGEGWRCRRPCWSNS